MRDFDAQYGSWKQSNPDKYNRRYSQTLNNAEDRYDKAWGVPDYVQISAQQNREAANDAALREQASKQPGIYRLSDGTTITSSLGAGRYANNVTVTEGKRQYASVTERVSSEANFQNTKGEQQRVTYTKEEPTPRKTIPNSGITAALDRGGAFGRGGYAERVGMSAQTIERQQPPRPQYSSAYGYNTNAGRVELFVEKPQAKPKERTPSFKEQREKDRARMNAALGTLNENPREAAEAFGQPFLTVPGGVIERGSQKARGFIEQRIPAGENYVGRRVLVETESFGRYVRTNPTGTVNQAAFGLATGAAGGRIVGYGVTKVAAKYGIARAAATESAVNIGGTALVGGSVIVAPEGSIGRSVPGFVAGGVGFAKAYRQSVPSPSITLEPTSGTAARTTITENTISGTANLRYVGRVQQYGRTETVAVESPTIFSGERIPGTNLFGVRVQSNTGVPVGSSPIRYKGATVGESPIIASSESEFIGIYNSKTNVLLVGNRQGTFYGSQGGKPRAAMYDGAASIEASPSRFFVAESNAAGIPRVTRVGAVRNLHESQAVTALSYDRTEPMQLLVRPPFEAKAPLNFVGAPKTSTIVESNAVVVSKRSGGADPELFSGAFQNLERVGAYRNPKITQRPPLGDVVRGEAKAFLSNRRGTIMQGKSRSATTTQQPRIRPEGTLRNPKPLEFSGLPVTAPKLPYKTPFASAIVPRYDASPGIAQRQSSRTDTKPGQRTKADTITLPRNDQITLTDSGTVQESAFRFDTRSTTTPKQDTERLTAFPGLDTGTPPPPIIPMFGALPNFAPPGRNGRDVLGSPQSFRYTPSVTAGVFNIRGKAPKGVLTGLEVRPLAQKKRRRK